MESRLADKPAELRAFKIALLRDASATPVGLVERARVSNASFDELISVVDESQSPRFAADVFNHLTEGAVDWPEDKIGRERLVQGLVAATGVYSGAWLAELSGQDDAIVDVIKHTASDDRKVQVVSGLLTNYSTQSRGSLSRAEDILSSVSPSKLQEMMQTDVKLGRESIELTQYVLGNALKAQQNR